MSEDPKRREFYRKLYAQIEPPKDGPRLEVWRDGETWRMRHREIPEEIVQAIGEVLRSRT